MKSIYLDMNVYSEYIYKDRSLNAFVSNLISEFKSNGLQFLYSPAHIEEVALILGSDKEINKANGYIENILENISKITNNYECLPTCKEIIIKQENPKVCYKRVIDGYLLTSIAEINEKFGVQCKRENVDNMLSNYDINRNEIGSIEAGKLFSDKIVSKIYFDFIKIHNLKIEKWQTIQNHHKKIEQNISVLFDFLEAIGYKSSGSKEYRSMMHDVTHAIYGTKSDILITNDIRFKLRLEAIYNYLQIPTKVFLLKELDNNEKLNDLFDFLEINKESF